MGESAEDQAAALPNAEPSALPGSQPTLAPSTRVLLSLAGAVILLVGMSLARDVLTPLFVAAVLVIIVHPVRTPLERHGWPRWLATTAVVVVAYLVLAVLGALVLFAAGQFAALIPQYADELHTVVDQGAGLLTSLGFDADAAADATRRIDPATLVNAAGAIVHTVTGLATSFFFVLAYLLFMAADAARFEDTARRFAPTKARAIAVIRRYCTSVRRYFVVNALFGAVVAVIDGALLALLGIPGAPIWAILAFVTNFIPNIGFVIGLIPPAILALVVGGWPLAIAVVLIYSIVNVTLQELVQPRFVSEAVGLSLTLTFLSVVFWTFVIGPVGAILSVPLTLLLRALLLENDDDAAWVRRLSGDMSDETGNTGSEARPAA